LALAPFVATFFIPARMSLIALAELAVETLLATGIVFAFLCAFWPGNVQAPKKE
jgi:hypothetical protein